MIEKTFAGYHHSFMVKFCCLLFRHLAEKMLLPRFSSGKSLQEPILIEAQAIHSKASGVGVDAPLAERTMAAMKRDRHFSHVQLFCVPGCNNYSKQMQIP